MEPEHRTVIFVVAVLYSLDPKWRGLDYSSSFVEILDGSHGINIHRAWRVLKEEGLLGEFGRDFYFDSLYATSTLTCMVQQAFVLYHLIGMDGSYNWYHLDVVDVNTINRLIKNEHISAELVANAAARLNQLLDEQQKQVTEPRTSM